MRSTQTLSAIDKVIFIQQKIHTLQNFISPFSPISSLVPDLCQFQSVVQAKQKEFDLISMAEENSDKLQILDKELNDLYDIFANYFKAPQLIKRIRNQLFLIKTYEKFLNDHPHLESYMGNFNTHSNTINEIKKELKDLENFLNKNKLSIILDNFFNSFVSHLKLLCNPAMQAVAAHLTYNDFMKLQNLLIQIRTIEVSVSTLSNEIQTYLNRFRVDEGDTLITAADITSLDIQKSKKTRNVSSESNGEMPKDIDQPKTGIFKKTASPLVLFKPFNPPRELLELAKKRSQRRVEFDEDTNDWCVKENDGSEVELKR